MALWCPVAGSVFLRGDTRTAAFSMTDVPLCKGAPVIGLDIAGLACHVNSTWHGLGSLAKVSHNEQQARAPGPTAPLWAFEPSCWRY